MGIGGIWAENDCYPFLTINDIQTFLVISFMWNVEKGRLVNLMYGRKHYLSCSDWEVMMRKWSPGKKEGSDSLSKLLCSTDGLVYLLSGVHESYKPTEPSCSIGEHRTLSSSVLGKKYRRGDLPKRRPFCTNDCAEQPCPFSFLFSVFQGRHVKTGQLAAIKVMDVTEVSLGHKCF